MHLLQGMRKTENVDASQPKRTRTDLTGTICIVTQICVIYTLATFTLHDVIFEDIAVSKKCGSHSFQSKTGPLSVIKLQGGKVTCLQLVSRRAGERAQAF